MEECATFWSETSLHGWFHFNKQRNVFSRLFWLFVIFASLGVAGWLVWDSVNAYNSSKTKIDVEDRSAELDDAFFPSVVVCNVSPVRKSFIYWLKDGLAREGKNVQTAKLFKMIRKQLNGKHMSESEISLLNDIFESNFYTEEFQNFLTEMAKRESFDRTWSSSKLFLWSDVSEAELTGLPHYHNTTKKLWHDIYLYQMASQWQLGQMIPYIEWNGADLTDPVNDTGLVVEVGMGTNFGICTWLTPMFRMPDPDEPDPTDLVKLKPGAHSGSNNGLTLLLDAETFDYGGGDEELIESGGESLIVSIVHPLDMPIMEQTGVGVAPGNLSTTPFNNSGPGTAALLAVSTTLLNITEDAVVRFPPEERKCWTQEEITLQYLNYPEGYRYAMANCLHSATMQKAYNTCKCFPGATIIRYTL